MYDSESNVDNVFGRSGPGGQIAQETRSLTFSPSSDTVDAFKADHSNDRERRYILFVSV